MIKIAFFDVDGTLLKFGNKELSEKTRKALLALQRNHVLICMATEYTLYHSFLNHSSFSGS